MAGLTEGSPGDVEPALAGEKLVGLFVDHQKRDEALKLCWVFWADVGGTALKVLGGPDATDERVYPDASETAIDDDGTADSLSGRLQEHQATEGQIDNCLHWRNVVC